MTNRYKVIRCNVSEIQARLDENKYATLVSYQQQLQDGEAVLILEVGERWKKEHVNE